MSVVYQVCTRMFVLFRKIRVAKVTGFILLGLFYYARILGVIFFKPNKSKHGLFEMSCLRPLWKWAIFICQLVMLSFYIYKYIMWTLDRLDWLDQLFGTDGNENLSWIKDWFCYVYVVTVNHIMMRIHFFWYLSVGVLYSDLNEYARSEGIRDLHFEMCGFGGCQEWQKMVEVFLSHLNQFELRVTILGLFDVSMEFYLEIASGIVTYLIFVIQTVMQLENEEETV
ncbi:uncharacterized protein Dana_GF19950 [Drosophila ananassae]|uniref:Gustatory receptor n=1 Tax=Drosophila ananassae TaxID=7217 RepID=B3LY72_DROAN|nr:uncharacterized protein Dana_GF19950 [Drosophila ananassae]